MKSNEFPSPPAEDSELQKLVDDLFSIAGQKSVKRMDVLLRAEMVDLSPDMLEVIELLPSGTYTRPRLCAQLNSILTAHGWGFIYGTVQ